MGHQSICRRPWFAATLAAAVFSAVCACRTTSSDASSAVKDDSGNTTTSSGPATGVLEHHNRATRDGLYIDGAFTKASVANLHPVAGFSATYQGAVYAQPLYVANGPQGHAAVIVATENNDVFAFDAQTGATLWTKNLGQPMPMAQLPCGNIDPLGITGTPVIDANSRTIILDAMTQQSGAPHHEIFGLSLDDGSIVSGWPIDLASISAGGVNFDSSVQNQRGALTILNGVAYVPYGGFWGDCGTYHGWVVGVPLANPAGATAWVSRAQGAGAWGPSGVASDGQAVFVATGNSFSASAWTDGEAILRLTTQPTFSTLSNDFFAPTNWLALDNDDIDVGGSGVLLTHVNGASPADLAVAFGKDGNVYLASQANLGGLGGQLSSLQISSGQIITAGAAYQTAQSAYVVARSYSGKGLGCPASQANGTLIGVSLSPLAPPTPRVAWCAVIAGRGAPTVTTSDGQSDAIVWTVSTEADNKLWAVDGDTGQVLFTSAAMSKVMRFQPPIIANGRLYVAGVNALYAFTPQ